MAPIVVTCGDPNGIGPEIILKSAVKGLLGNAVVIGSTQHFRSAIDSLNMDLTVRSIAKLSDRMVSKEGVTILDYPFSTVRNPGAFEPKHAAGVIGVLEKAIELCMSGEASAMVTAPINKAVLKEGANYPFPGHTELLAARSGTDTPVMMLASPELRTVPVTIHEALADIPRVLTKELFEETVNVAHVSLQKMFGIEEPRLVVAGLNPHAGEEGKIGTEELEWINESVQNFARQGMNIIGPLPADTMFHAAKRSTYDVAICMYHDQALIPVKTIGFDEGVNVTLGLPFIRTSPDHGTAFDIADQGTANPQSFISALNLAQDLAARNDR